MYMSRMASIGVAGLAIAFSSPALAQSQKNPAPAAARSAVEKTHRVVIQVTQNDPAVMNMALNNAENLVKYYNDKGEKIEIEFVAYGTGLSMVRSDISPVKDRLTALSSLKNVTFSGCGNTMAGQSKQENKSISLVPEARIVPSGIARIVELSESGWTYVRP